MIVLGKKDLSIDSAFGTTQIQINETNNEMYWINDRIKVGKLIGCIWLNIAILTIHLEWCQRDYSVIQFFKVLILIWKTRLG